MQDFSSGTAGSSNITDDNTGGTFGHGTHVAGIIAATANNGIGVAGVSYNRAKVIPYKVFKNNTCSSYTILDAYKEAVADGCKVVNMSLGGYGNDLALEAEINSAYAQGVITVASAGNGNKSDFLFPSDFEKVISVTATTSSNVRWTSSDYSVYKDIAAPGASIYSTVPGGYATKTGTSMAAPYICGVIALLWSSYPDLTAGQIKDLLYSTATDKGDEGRDDYYGHGLVNAEAALQEANDWYDQEQTSYLVNFNSKGGSEVSSTIRLEDEAIGYLPSTSKQGYKFLGWYTASSGGNKIAITTKINKNITYYAHWEPNKYKVTFKSRGGNAISAKTVSHASAVGTLKSPKRSGYKFLGWYTAASGGSKIKTTTKIKKNVTYYAHWVRVYTVKWNARGGKVKVASKVVNKAAKIGTLQTPTKKGYKFLGWYTKASGGTKISKNTKINGSKTYYAHWRRK
jgi:uncharacterized repeat protein (TIGR02543 family)